jgi:hypothetical protein
MDMSGESRESLPTCPVNLEKVYGHFGFFKIHLRKKNVQNVIIFVFMVIFNYIL